MNNNRISMLLGQAKLNIIIKCIVNEMIDFLPLIGEHTNLFEEDEVEEETFIILLFAKWRGNKNNKEKK